MTMALPVSAPHAHAASRVQIIMFTVALALVPATGFAFYAYGWPAVYLWAVTIAAGLVTEALAVKWRGRSVSSALLDGSSLVASWILALALPPWAPWWIGVTGAVIAVGLGKHAFGGLGQNLFNPAMVARVALLLAFPRAMTLWPAPENSHFQPWSGLLVTFGRDNAAIVDAQSGATILDVAKLAVSQGESLSGVQVTVAEMGQRIFHANSGSLGEVSALLLVLGGLLLLVRGVISWHIPCGVFCGLGGLAVVFQLVAPERYLSLITHLTSGATVLTALFIATDPVTSPVTARGRFAFGLGIGVLMFVIRSWGAFPEGAAFSVLFMNALVPLLDERFRPRQYGRDRRGRPLSSAVVLGRGGDKCD